MGNPVGSIANTVSTGSADYSWTKYPITSHYGATDAEGNYWQPDVNVGVPANYPITNLLSGTVTNVRDTSWGQQVVTIKLDQPLNDLATHIVYQHIRGSNLSQGQHISSGALVGYNNPTPPYYAPVGVSLYSGDIYGSGPEWDVLQKDLAPGGQGLLKADWLIKKFAGTGSAGFQGLGSTFSAPPDTGCKSEYLNSENGLSAVDPRHISNAIVYSLCSVQTGLHNVLVRIGFFLLGLLCFILGGILLLGYDVGKVVKGAVTGGVA